MGTIPLMRRIPGNLSTRDFFLALPHIGKLCWRVVRDDRVPMWIRAGLGAVAAYLVLPVDVVPDWVPVLGQMDDVLLVTVGVRTLLQRVPDEILDEHWDGGRDILAKLLGHEPDEDEGPGSTRT